MAKGVSSYLLQKGQNMVHKPPIELKSAKVYIRDSNVLVVYLFYSSR